MQNRWANIHCCPGYEKAALGGLRISCIECLGLTLAAEQKLLDVLFSSTVPISYSFQFMHLLSVRIAGLFPELPPIPAGERSTAELIGFSWALESWVFWMYVGRHAQACKNQAAAKQAEQQATEADTLRLTKCCCPNVRDKTPSHIVGL